MLNCHCMGHHACGQLPETVLLGKHMHQAYLKQSDFVCTSFTALHATVSTTTMHGEFQKNQLNARWCIRLWTHNILLSKLFTADPSMCRKYLQCNLTLSQGIVTQPFAFPLGLMLEVSALETLYYGQFALPTPLIKSNYLVITPWMPHHSFFKILSPLIIFPRSLGQGMWTANMEKGVRDCNFLVPK